MDEQRQRLELGDWESGEVVSVDYSKAGRESMKRWITDITRLFGKDTNIRVIEAPSEEVKKYFEDYIKKVKNHYRKGVEV